MGGRWGGYDTGVSGEKGGYVVARLMQTGSWLSRKSWMSPPSHCRCVDQTASLGVGGGFIGGGGGYDRSEAGEKVGYTMARLIQTGNWLSRKSWMSPPSHCRCVDREGLGWEGGGCDGMVHG